MRYRREIDGLRAVAVLPVILFHAGVPYFDGGYIGVDIFFVISGYLIGTLLIEELNQQRFSLRQFYVRRARRILPTLLLVTAVCIPAAWVMITPDRLRNFAQSLFGVASFSSNIVFWLQSGYFEPAAIEKPLIHTWSLGVEEQFYALAPLCLLLIWRIRKDWLTPIVVITTGLSLVASVYASRYHPVANFFLAPTRAWELLSGVLCALVLINRPLKHSDPLTMVGLLLILISIPTLNALTPTPSLYAMPAVAGAALIILFGSNRGIAGRALASRLPVGIGLISYSAYLWHQPLFAFAHIRTNVTPGMTEMLALAVFSLVLAAVSWRFVERPVRHLRLKKWPTMDVWILATLMLLCGATGGVGAMTDGFKAHYVNTLGAEQKRLYNVIEHAREERPMFDDGQCSFYAQAMTPRINQRLARCNARYGPGIAIVGDSHAMRLYNAVAHSARRPFVFGIARGGCRAHDPLTYCPFDDFLSVVAETPGLFRKVVYEQAGFYLFRDAHGRVARRETFERENMPLYTLNKNDIADVVAYLTRLSRYEDVVWLGPHIEPHIELLSLVTEGCHPETFALQRNLRANFNRLDRSLQTAVERQTNPRLHYLSQLALIDFDIKTDLTDCKSVYWRDGDHWSRSGVRRFGKRVIDDLLND